jgi:hypothetical protein
VETVDAGGAQEIFRRLRWKPPDRDEVAELHRYLVRDKRGIVARAVCPAERFAELEPRLRELLASIAVGTPAARGGVVRTEDTAQSRTYAAFESGQLTTTRAQAFGLTPENGQAKASQVWEQTREAWQKARDER